MRDFLDSELAATLALVIPFLLAIAYLLVGLMVAS